MAGSEAPAAAGRIPWLAREGKFRFELGLRQNDGSFFNSSADHAGILAARVRVLDEHPARHAAILEEGEALLEEVRAFAHENTSDGEGLTPNEGDSPWDDCVDLGRHWEPDFLLLKPGADGVHRLVGGCVCFPSSWDLCEKLGHTVESIHAPVPTLNEHLGPQIHAFLSRMKPGTIWERWNWGLAATDALNHHPALHHPPLPPTATLADAWLRIEHQAFRPLVASVGLLFAIRVSVVSLSEFATQHDAARRLAELLETMPDDIATYKGLLTARHSLITHLRQPGNANGERH